MNYMWQNMIAANVHVPNRPLLWRHNRHDGVSNHQPHDCLLNRLFRRTSKKTSKLRVIGLCAGNSPVPAQRASNAENVSIWWRHHGFGHQQPPYWLDWPYITWTILRSIHSVYMTTSWKHFPRSFHLCGEITGDRWIPLTKPVTRSFDVFFDLRLNKWLGKQSRRRWFKTPSHSSWCHCNGQAISRGAWEGGK